MTLLDKTIYFIDAHYYLILFIIGLIICRLPYIGKYFKIIDTLFHELGHAIATLLMRGEVIAIELEKDTSGSTTYLTRKNVSHFFVSLLGYPFSALIALLLSYFYAIDSIKLFFFFIYGSLGVALFVFIRNLFGVVWISVFGLLLILLHVYINNLFQRDIIFVIISVLFWESIFSTLTLFMLAIKNPKNSGDAYDIYSITNIHPVFWALVFILIVGFVGFFTLKNLFPTFSLIYLKSIF